jgi:hypothetical protein
LQTNSFRNPLVGGGFQLTDKKYKIEQETHEQRKSAPSKRQKEMSVPPALSAQQKRSNIEQHKKNDFVRRNRLGRQDDKQYGSVKKLVF